MNVAGFAGIGADAPPAAAEAPGSGDPAGAGVNPTWTASVGAAIVFFPAASRIPNRNRFGPTTASDEMIWGMNGALPPTAVGGAALGGVEPAGDPPDDVHAAATKATEASATRKRTRRGGCTRAS